MSDEEIAAWVQRQMEGAPERDEAWAARTEAIWLTVLDNREAA